MIRRIISFINDKTISNENVLSEEEVEKRYWEYQEFASKGFLKGLSQHKKREWIYRNCTSLVYTEGVRYFASHDVMRDFVDIIGRLIYCLHKKPYYDQYKILLNISKDKRVKFYIRNHHNNVLIMDGHVPFSKSLPTTNVVAFALHRVKHLSPLQRQCMNFDKDENIDYLYGLSLVSEI